MTGTESEMRTLTPFGHNYSRAVSSATIRTLSAPNYQEQEKRPPIGGLTCWFLSTPERIRSSDPRIRRSIWPPTPGTFKHVCACIDEHLSMCASNVNMRV